jgi:KaiC/GvpD/RAD55 family RecA-like ATPase
MSAPRLARTLDPDFGADHVVEMSDQVIAAKDNLYRPDSDWLAWPWPDLTALCGRMKPRDVWFVCAFSGNGKTLFVSSAIREWTRAGVKTYVLPLENTADDFRLYMACQSVGIDPGVVNGGGLLDLPPALREEWERKIDAELSRQAEDRAAREALKVKGVDEINLSRLTMAAEEAAEWNARVLIVDHIDHIEGGDGSSLHAESVRVNKAAKQLAKKHDLIFLFTSQMNNESVKSGRDRLAQYGPPMPHHVFMGGHKRQIATGMIGLHRKLRDRLDTETEKEYAAALTQSRKGDVPPMGALAPNVMAATAMKLRNFGAREGNRCFLSVEHGIVGPLLERDRYSTTYDGLRRVGGRP